MLTKEGQRGRIVVQKNQARDRVRMDVPEDLVAKFWAEAEELAGRRRIRAKNRANVIEHLAGGLIVQWAAWDMLSTWLADLPGAGPTLTLMGRRFLIRSNWGDVENVYVHEKDREEDAFAYAFGSAHNRGHQVTMLGYATEEDLVNYARTIRRKDWTSYQLPAGSLRTWAELMDCIHTRNRSFQARSF